MKKLLKRRILFVFAFLFLPVCANATTIDFYTDGTIQSGDTYSTVNVWNTATVGMIGGQTFYCNVYNTALFNYTGGDVSCISAYDASIIDIDTAITPTLYLYEQSKVYLHNGGAGASILMYDNAQLHIYGYNLEYEDSASPNWVTGYWENGQQFQIYLRNIYDYDTTQVVLHEIPEPIILSLFGVGVFFIRANKARKN